MPLDIGNILKERYRVVGLLGQGGFGAVYRAWDMTLDRPCALKENLDASTSSRRQFEREVKILANLSHPSLPHVTDHFFLPGQGQYLVMDYIEGEDLQQKLDRTGKPLPEVQALEWIYQVCDALTYMHQQNPPVIHRDIKPANIRIMKSTTLPRGGAILVDFGIAKVYTPGAPTTVGARAVTPGFSPPEQYGQGFTDAQSDVYSLGATLYKLLTNRDIPDSVDIISGSIPPPSPARLVNLSVTSGVSSALERAMQVNRANRFNNIAEFKLALERGAIPPSSEPLKPLVARTQVALTPVARSHPAKAGGWWKDANMPGWLRAGLIGAAGVTVLNLLGLIPMVGCCTFFLGLIAYIAIGALAASYIPPVRAAGQGAGQGALASLVAGIVGSVVSLIISLVQGALMDSSAMVSQIPPELLQQMRDVGVSPEMLAGLGGAAIMGSLCCVAGMVIAAVLGAIGGAIYAAAKSQ